MPEISVIVPVYKVEPFLPSCLDSILGQTFTDFELILVDDGSPDGCPAMCDDYVRKDARVRVIHQENGGLSAARNRGIDAAIGKYLCFVDSDDLVAPDYLSYLYSLLQQHDADFSVCGTKRFSTVEELADWQEETATADFLSATAFFHLQLTPKTEMGVWNKLFRRELFDNIRFEDGRIHEDILFSVAIVPLCQRGVVLGSQQKYFYRQTSTGIMAQVKKKCHADRVYASQKVLDFGLSTKTAELDTFVDYALRHPWFYVDTIYVHRRFSENKEFLQALQHFLREYLPKVSDSAAISPLLFSRMRLFSRSRFLYGFNAYARLIWVYVCRILHIDAYRNGHGI